MSKLLAPPREAPRFKEALDGFTSRHGTNAAPSKFVKLKVRRGAELMAPLIRAAAECDAIIAGGAVRWMCSPLSDPVRGAAFSGACWPEAADACSRLPSARPVNIVVKLGE